MNPPSEIKTNDEKSEVDNEPKSAIRDMLTMIQSNTQNVSDEEFTMAVIEIIESEPHTLEHKTVCRYNDILMSHKIEPMIYLIPEEIIILYRSGMRVLS